MNYHTQQIISTRPKQPYEQQSKKACFCAYGKVKGCLTAADRFNAEIEYNYSLIQYTFQQVNMSDFNPKCFSLTPNTHKPKKYSLRDSQHHRKSSKPDAECSLQSSHREERRGEVERVTAEKSELKQDFSLFASTLLDISTFNLQQSPQNGQEFNRKASNRAISTRISLDQAPPTSSMLRAPSNSTLFNKREQIKEVQLSNVANGNESLHYQNHTRKSSQVSQSKIRSTNYFQYKQQDNQFSFHKTNRNKFSLKKSRALSSTRSSQLTVSLCYADLRFPLRALKSEQLREMHDFRENLQKYEGENKLAKFLCGNFMRSSKYGCICEPKCHWTNRWLSLAQYQEVRNNYKSFPSNQWEAIMKQIQKDIPRTQVNSQTFLQEDYKHRLREVLMGYCKLDWEIGYVQGMNIVASVMVYHTCSAFEALKLFQLLMKQINLRQIYASDLSFGSKVAVVLVEELKRSAFDLYSHLQSQGLDISMFATSWYLSLLGAFVPLEWMHVVVQKFIRRGWTGINEVILAVLLYFKQQLMASDCSEIMEILSCKDMQQRAKQIGWNELAIRSDNLLLPLIHI